MNVCTGKHTLLQHVRARSSAGNALYCLCARLEVDEGPRSSWGLSGRASCRGIAGRGPSEAGRAQGKRVEAGEKGNALTREWGDSGAEGKHDGRSVIRVGDCRGHGRSAQDATNAPSE